LRALHKRRLVKCCSNVVVNTDGPDNPDGEVKKQRRQGTYKMTLKYGFKEGGLNNQGIFSHKIEGLRFSLIVCCRLRWTYISLKESSCIINEIEMLIPSHFLSRCNVFPKSLYRYSREKMEENCK